jgi:hypothetical protein
LLPLQYLWRLSNMLTILLLTSWPPGMPLLHPVILSVAIWLCSR